MSEWLQAVIWGLVQGLTEFLPISSSGHLVVVPGFLGLDPPDLATSALLHLGTLVAVLIYYRSDVARVLRFASDTSARKLLLLLVVGTLPSALALLVEDRVEALQASSSAVGVALIATAGILWFSEKVQDRSGGVEGMTWRDAFLIGFAQLLAVIPGISRSGSTITASMWLGLEREEAARFSFLLGIPAITAAGTLEGLELLNGGGIPASAWLGVAVAAVSGYAAIALLLRVLRRVGLRPFATYCALVGATAILFL
jgi:undecaprenyl-diphosphatase